MSSPSPSSAEAKRLRTEFAGDGGGGGARERFLEARRDFESGVRAYMREDAEVRVASALFSAHSMIGVANSGQYIWTYPANIVVFAMFLITYVLIV